MNRIAFLRTGALALWAIFGFHEAAYAATPDTKGKEFIFGIPTPTPPESSPRIWITAAQAATGTVQVPGVGFTQNFAVPAGGSALVELPVEAYYGYVTDIVNNTGVRISATQEVNVSFILGRVGSVETIRVLPVDVLGKDHLVIGFNSDAARSRFLVVAAEDGTAVEITP